MMRAGLPPYGSVRVLSPKGVSEFPLQRERVRVRGKAAYAAGFHRLNRDKQGVFLSGEDCGKRIIFKLESRFR